MDKEDLKAIFEALGKNGPLAAGDFVLEKNVEYEIDNVEAGGIGIQIINTPATETSEIRGDDTPDANPLPFEEAMPQFLRTGKMMTAWIKLKEAGILRDDFQLADPKASVAHRIAQCFNQKLKEINPRIQQANWACFEKFWGYDNLRTRSGDISKQTETTISTIFREL